MFGLARFVYRPISQAKTTPPSASSSMARYIDKQKQALVGIKLSEFDAKASQLLEQFMSDTITMTDTAKNNPKHLELQQFARDSTYSWGYNLEGVKIIQEDLGLRPKHEGKHCDSVGSC